MLKLAELRIDRKPSYTTGQNYFSPSHAKTAYTEPRRATRRPTDRRSLLTGRHGSITGQIDAKTAEYVFREHEIYTYSLTHQFSATNVRSPTSSRKFEVQRMIERFRHPISPQSTLLWIVQTGMIECSFAFPKSSRNCGKRANSW